MAGDCWLEMVGQGGRASRSGMPACNVHSVNETENPSMELPGIRAIPIMHDGHLTHDMVEHAQKQ